MNSDAKIKLSMAQKKERFNKFHYGLNSPPKNDAPCDLQVNQRKDKNIICHYIKE